ncbi:hypothetical protein BHE74_00055138 [Ensete ventricosum]|nr:hypothetical protein BHE74_00055138 [Ensete ventricosum]RZR94345.1 hypothetical protein BHM03_00023035 [Ensete ventricosum]
MDEEDYYFGESDGDDGGSSYSLEGDDGDDLNDLLVEEPVDISTTASGFDLLVLLMSLEIAFLLVLTSISLSVHHRQITGHLDGVSSGRTGDLPLRFWWLWLLVVLVKGLSVLTYVELCFLQKDVLRNVMDLLLVSEQQARSLLIYYRWNVQKVYDSFERKGKERLFQDVGVVISDSRDLDISGSSTAVITCNICFEDVAVLDATKMDCGHLFCNDCEFPSLVLAGLL